MPVASAPEQTSQPLADPTRSSFETNDAYLVYPADMSDVQDRVQFTAVEIPKSTLNELPSGTDLRETLKAFTSPTGLESSKVNGTPYVILPIQSGISDNNSVEWGGATLNAIERYLAGYALQGMSGGAAGVENALKETIGKLYQNKDNIFGTLKGAGQLALTEQAVGVQNLISRVTGNVLNPNLELLFRGPTLRPFQFQFKLSPRNQEEANKVKKIIKFFKKNMAVKKGELFLKAPYAFNIKYQKGKKFANEDISTHPSIGQIKTCALQSCSVDYTPLGSYMTYNDNNATMVSYNISLQFQEIVPIYDEDYNNHDIGY